MKLATGSLILFVLAVAALGTSGCNNSSNNSGQGFYMGSQYCVQPIGTTPGSPCDPSVDQLLRFPYVPVTGTMTQPETGMLGNVDYFGIAFTSTNVETNSGNNPDGLSYYFVEAGDAPAQWDLRWISPRNCSTQNLYAQGLLPGTTIPFWEYDFPNVQVPQKGLETWYCAVSSNLSAASSRFEVVGSFPGTITLGADVPFTSQWGMPILNVYDGTGLVATETATSISSDGSQATFPFPSSLTQNGYSLAVANQIPEPYGYSTAGFNLLSIASSQTIAGNPFGVAAAGLTDTLVDWDRCNKITWDYTPVTNTFPVITLYSMNQVLANGVAINVGAKPTAVSTYSSGSEQTIDREGCDWYTNTYTDTNRAIVANSGGNTASILDLTNDTVLSTVTVGNEPVALAVSSDGTTAYVANYGDSTVTKVNLITDTPVTTIAVGGQPTSVALTAAGVLWVGGVGFLTEINTQGMSVIATESTSGRTIAGLGFSDAENELIATSTVGTGNVSIDEISPSSVQTGGPYATVASHSVSTLGTFYNPRIQAQSFGFTSTLTSSLIPINTAQAGAPPLVVQDGWAVVTATPTGFSITDASGHVVLVSETTPSPIAAIAVDTNLNVAYLTMPDSNTLLTVPLPGTGTN